MPISGANRRITESLQRWDGIETGPHRFGGTEYRLGTREIGHIHGDHMVDIPFPKAVRNEVIDKGLAQPHHILPDTGWVSLYLHSAADIDEAIALLRRSYDIAQVQLEKRHSKFNE